MRGNYKNAFYQDAVNSQLWSIVTEPHFAIGQRCFFIQTDGGNVLWDCITYLDQETVDWINAKGGLKAIVISHPHFYTTHLDWAAAFNCEVYVAGADRSWLSRSGQHDKQVFLTESSNELWSGGPQALILGGHFPGSMVLLWNKMLFVADTLMSTPVNCLHYALRSKLTLFSPRTIQTGERRERTATCSCILIPTCYRCRRTH